MTNPMEEEAKNLRPKLADVVDPDDYPFGLPVRIQGLMEEAKVRRIPDEVREMADPGRSGYGDRWVRVDIVTRIPRGILVRDENWKLGIIDVAWEDEH